MTKVYTIGHSNHSLQRFLASVDQHGITRVVDVRSQPYSRWVPHFNKGRLSEALTEVGVTYVHLPDLGGRPSDPALTDDSGEPDYEAIAASRGFQESLGRLIDWARQEPTAIMCAEADYLRCHRHMLIEPALLERGVQVLHIQADGSLRTGGVGFEQPPLL